MTSQNIFSHLVRLSLVLGFAFVIVGEAKAQDIKGWQKAIVAKIRDNQDYPRSAITRQLEGRAQIRVTIGADGTIQDYEILEQTGHDVLDRQVPRLLKRLDPLPAPPAKLLKDGSFTFKLPLVWRLG